MKPVLFNIPLPFLNTNIPVFAFETFHAIGWILVIFFSIRLAQRRGIAPNIIIHASLYGAIGFVTGARLFSLIQHLSFYLKNPADILKVWEGGMVFYGGFIGGLIVVLVYLIAKKIEIGVVLDCFSAPLGLGIFFGRTACFFQGCCFGKPTNLPWAVVYPRNTNVYYEQLRQLQIPPLSSSSLPVHPVQLYEAIEGIIGFIVFSLIFTRRKTSKGEVFCGFILFYAVIRFINEFFRGDEIRGFVWRPYLSVSQTISVILIMISAYSLWKIFKQERESSLKDLQLNTKIKSAESSFFSEIILVTISVLTISYFIFNLIKRESSSQNKFQTSIEQTEIDISFNAFEGEQDTPVTIIEFFDFECPYCQRFFESILNPLRNDYIKTGKVKFVYKHFPLSFHKNALKAAEAVECAKEQGKFIELHDKLFEYFGEVSIKKIKLYANDIGIDSIRFNNCINSDRKKKIILRDQKEGLNFGVSGTPTIFINGKKLSGFQNYDIIKNIIESELRAVTK